MSDPRLVVHRSSLVRQILIAIGLPAAVAAAAATSCGGEAVVDPDEAGGGSPTSTSSTSSSASTSSSSSTASWTEGRPFAIDGVAQVANACRRDDWRDSELVPDVAGLDRATRQALADAWQRDARFEHASIASFARFILELLAVGAPPALVRDAQTALADEIRHAELCFGLASTYGDQDIGPAALPIAQALEDRASLAAIAVATVHEGCINETLATLVAMAAQDQAADPAVRAVLAEITADEARHAALAWRFVAWACAQEPAVRTAVAEAFESGLGAELPVEALRADADEQQLRSHGRLSATAQADIARQGLAQVIEPCIRTMLSSEPDQASQAIQDALTS